MRACLAVCLVLSCLAAFAVGAEPGRPLAAGDRVRITTRGQESHTVGLLLSIDTEQLRVHLQHRPDSAVVHRPDIVQLERSAGRHSRGHDAALGAGIGLVAGGLTGLALGDDPPGEMSFTAGDKAVVLGGALAILGALIGLIPTPAERWEEIPLDAIPASASRVGGSGAGIGFTARF